MPVIEHIERCSACQGTGLCVGMAERDGIAVVCHRCEGTGAYKFTHQYDEFTGRKENQSVLHVIQCNPGVVVGRHGADRTYEFSDFGGMSADDWKSGKPFPKGSEMRNATCPAWWYQTADYSKKPDWAECSWGLFSKCRHFGNKAKCWERWDAEQSDK